MKLDFVSGFGLDCPMVRLYGREPERVRELMLALNDVARFPVAIHGLPGIEAIDGCRLIARVGKRDRGVRKLKDGGFDWEMEPEGWAHVIGFLEPFAEPQPEGTFFQYLSREGEITVLVSTDGRW
jgi:hypothetical protein